MAGTANGTAVDVDGLFFAGIVDTNDGWVRHAGRGLGLLAEAGFKTRVICKIALEQLDCNHATESGIKTLIYVGHAAATNQVSQLVTACDDSLVVAQCCSELASLATKSSFAYSVGLGLGLLLSVCCV